MALQQFSGVNTIMYYGAAILIMCGFEEKDSVALTAVLAPRVAGIVVRCRLGEVRAAGSSSRRPWRRRRRAMRRPALGRYRHASTSASRRRHHPRRPASGCRRPLGRQRGDLPDAPRGPGQGGGVHGERTANYVGRRRFVAVQGARPMSTFALSLYIAGGRRLAARGPAGTAGRSPGGSGPLSGALPRASPHGRRRGPTARRRRRGREGAIAGPRCRRASGWRKLCMCLGAPPTPWADKAAKLGAAPARLAGGPYCLALTATPARASRSVAVATARVVLRVHVLVTRPDGPSPARRRSRRRPRADRAVDHLDLLEFRPAKAPPSTPSPPWP